MSLLRLDMAGLLAIVGPGVGHGVWLGLLGLGLACSTLASLPAHAQEQPLESLAPASVETDAETPPATVNPGVGAVGETTPHGSYGYQLAIADGLLLPAVTLSLWGIGHSQNPTLPLLGLSYGLELLAPVLIHGFNGASPGKIGWSFALRTVLPAAFTILGGGAVAFSENTPLKLLLVSPILGSLLAAVLDDVLLARRPGDPPTGRLRRTLAIVLLVASSLAVASLAVGMGRFLYRLDE